MRSYQILGACSCWGAQIRACEKGPEDLVEHAIFSRLQGEGAKIAEVALLYPERRARDGEVPLGESLPLIHSFNLRLAKRVEGVVREGHFPVVIGGDHVNAVGMWNGVRRALGGELGLVWVDAHMDSHTPETTPSGAWHGMPLAALMGYGEGRLAWGEVVKPERVALVGVRSFEEGERALLERLKVKVYEMEEVRQRGFGAVMREAVGRVKRGAKGFGVSLDLDVVDPEEAPGVGSPETGGIGKRELLEGVEIWMGDPQLQAWEIVEYNPERDRGAKTRQLIYELLKRGLV